MNLKAMREALAKKLGQITALKGLESPTAEQAVELDALLTEGEQLKSQIEAAEAAEKRAASLASWAGQSSNPMPAPGLPTGDGTRKAVAIPATVKHRRSEVFKSAEEAYAFGMYALATIWKHARAQEWCKSHGYEPVWKAQSESDNTGGGYLVPSEFGEVIDALVATYGTVRQYCTITTMMRDTKNHPKRPTLIRMRPAAELGTVTADTFRFGNVELTARKWMLFIQSSSEINEDAAISLADELARLIAESAAYTEDDALWNADGTSTYNRVVGIFNAMANASSVGLLAGTSTIDTYAEITLAQLYAMKAALPSAVVTNGDVAWYCTQKASVNVFERLALAAGGATAAEILAGAQPRFLGYPVRVQNGMTDNEASGGYALALGSLRKGVVFGTRRELEIVSSREAGFFTDSEYVRASTRWDLAVHEPGTSSAVGAFVVQKFLT